MDSVACSEHYRAFRDSLIPKLTLSLRDSAEFYEPIPITEKLVQAVWSEQLLDSSHLKTASGKSVEILHPGNWNVEGGPDFRDACIRINGVELTGDIEIHLHANDWHLHQHRTNREYNRVILDVSLWGSENATPPKTEEGNEIEQVYLHQFLQCSLSELAESLDPDRYPYSRKKTRFPIELPIPKKELAHYIASAGMYRLHQKTSRLESYISEVGESQCAYEALAEAFGYKHNKLSFRKIASYCKIEQLENMSCEDKIDRLLHALKSVPLRRGQIRPANHPERRLAALAILIDQYPDLPAYFESIFKAGPKANPPNIEHVFWSFHYHRNGKSLQTPVALLGRDRWCEILANVIVPFSCAFGAQKNLLKAPMKLGEEFWENLAPSQSNLAGRYIAFELGLKSPRSVLEQQGLMQLFQDIDLFITEAPPRTVSA